MLNRTFFRVNIIFSTLLFLTACGGGGDDGGNIDPPQNINNAPIANDITGTIDESTPYFNAQLVGIDSDGDNLFYSLISNPKTDDYVAYLDFATGILYLEIFNRNRNEISLDYQVFDGDKYSNIARAKFSIGNEIIEERKLGGIEIDLNNYNEVSRVLFDPIFNIPSSVDLSGGMPPPGNQGQQGSCVGWAVAYALKTQQEKIEQDWPITYSTSFSPAWIYNQINGGQDRGSRIIEALNLIITDGAATFSTMPYDQSNFTRQPSSQARSEASNYKGSKVFTIGGTQQIKQAIAHRIPVVISIPAFKSIFSLQNVYIPSGDLDGFHAVTITGYDDNKFGGSFKIINSWGQNWGESGFFWLPYNSTHSGGLHSSGYVLKPGSTIRESYVLLDKNNTDNGNNSLSGNNDGLLNLLSSYAEVNKDLPNLQIESWELFTSGIPGDNSRFGWKIINSGNTKVSGDVTVTLTFSEDEVFNSEDYIAYKKKVTIDLEPGESLDHTGSDGTTINETSYERLVVPPIQAGTYFTAVIVDDENEIQESIEIDNNNIGNNIEIVQSDLPDYKIEEWGFSNCVIESVTTSCDLNYEITNVGTVVSNTPSIQVVFREKELASVISEIPFIIEKSSFLPNESHSATVGVAFNNNITEDIYDAELQLNYDNRIVETNPYNNYDTATRWFNDGQEPLVSSRMTGISSNISIKEKLPLQNFEKHIRSLDNPVNPI